MTTEDDMQQCYNEECVAYQNEMVLVIPFRISGAEEDSFVSVHPDAVAIVRRHDLEYSLWVHGTALGTMTEKQGDHLRKLLSES